MGQNIQKKFTRIENQVRMEIMNFIIAEERPYHLELDKNRVLKACNIEEVEYRDITACLCEKDGMVADETGNVNFIYPVSAVPTNHKVTLDDGRCFTAMCAIDAIGAAFTFGQDVDIQSVCSGCGVPIHVAVSGGELKEYTPADLHILSFRLEELVNWAGSC